MADNVDPDPPPPPAEDVPPPEVVVAPPMTPLPPDAPPPRQGCMAKRSCLEKVLIVLVIIIIVIVLFVLAAFLIFYFFYSPPEGTCLKDECVASASRLKDYMDDSADPCNNFYEYACGGWLKRQVLAPDEAKKDLITTISDANNVKIRLLLEKEISSTDQTFLKKPKKLYKACMNMDRLNELGAEPFLDLVEDVGKFPVLSPDWNATDFNLEDMLVNLGKLARMPLFSVAASRDLRENTINRIYIGDAALALGSRTKYLEGRADPRVMQYEKWLVDSLVLLGVDRAQAEEQMKEVVDLEIRIARMMRDNVLKADQSTSYNPMKVAIIQSRYPYLDWLKFFNGYGQSPKDISGVVIDIEETVINLEPEYFTKLGELIDETPTRVLANYLMSSLMVYTSALGQDFVTLVEEYDEEVMNTKPTPRWEQCTKLTTKIFPDFVSRMYVDNFFSAEAKSDVIGMIGNLTAVFKNMIRGNKWMTDKTKKLALEKVESMDYKVGYPDDLKDDEKLNEKYKTISANEYAYMKTLIDHKLYITNENVKKLRARQDKSIWPVPAATVNAHYNVLSNEIIFPAAFLQPPVYSPEYSDSMNYGGIGMVVGHEITHGFDVVGSQYDANGELKSWWTPKDKQNFDSRTQCFVDQYGCYKWDGHSIDGKLTLSENIADNGGIKTSYKAYADLLRRRGVEEQRLPGLDLNHRQIFFLSFAQVWCGKVRPALKKEMVQTDNHTPLPYRVYGSLQNSDDFAKAFSCPADSRMNPGRKCLLW